MDINNYYDEVPVPSLDSATYAADMQDMVDKINENFRRLGSAAWLKGDRGASAESNEELLFDENENTTDLGRAVFATIYKDYGIEDVQDSNLDTYSSIRNFVSGIEGTATTSFDNITTDSTVTVLGIYEPGEDIEYTLEEGWFAGPWFFNDSRCDVLDQMTEAELQRFNDMSCVLYGSYDGENWSIDSYYIMPTFYWNSDSNMFCWKIDGRTTNVTAQGVKGEKGDNANSYVFLGGDIDYSPNPTELNVTLNNVWWKGEDETWGWKSVNSLTDDEKAALTGCLGLVWFRRAYVEPTNDEEHYTPTFTMGIIQNAENMYIEYNEGGGTDIQFDFAQIMSIMSLKNSLSNITAGRAIPQTNDVLRGLFLPIEYTDNTGTPHIEQTNKYHEMWSTLDGTGDLNIGVVTDVDNPVADEDTTANINVYYKNFNTDTSKTRIEARDVTTGSADAGEIDLCAENDVDIIAGNMVDIDTPLVEMGNDDNKSNAVVHGKLNITGSEKDEDKIVITKDWYRESVDPTKGDLCLCVIARPKNVNFEEVDYGTPTFITNTTFEFIFGYCGYFDLITTTDTGGTTMPVLYNAQSVEMPYYAVDNNQQTYYTTIDGRDMEIIFSCEKLENWYNNSALNLRQDIWLPKVTINYTGDDNNVYSVFLDYTKFIYDPSGALINKTIGLFNDLKQGVGIFRNGTVKNQIYSSTSIQGMYPLLQFFMRNGNPYKRTIVSRVVERIGEYTNSNNDSDYEYEIRDNNINGYSYWYEYTYGWNNFRGFEETSEKGTGTTGTTHYHLSQYLFHTETQNGMVLLSYVPSNNVMQILQNGTWTSTMQQEKTSKTGNDCICLHILPKGMVGYHKDEYVSNTRFYGNKLYNGCMTLSLYHLNPSYNVKGSNTNSDEDANYIRPGRDPFINVVITTPNEDDHSLLPDVETDNP